ncbi:MAG: GAF domain-containing sensor histidine kinase, partial [Chloroflexi bacterium]|nr:GAF domain-containing sensor histidine kinase [Chloroflexota bacterium]
QSGHFIGQVLVLRDITEHKMADEARQQSHAKLLNLLRAISSTASQTLNLEDFLTESIQQLVYSFHSQSGVIFLLDEHGDESDKHSLSIVSHYGLSTQELDILSSSNVKNNLVAWIQEFHEPQSIPNISADTHFSRVIQQISHRALLISPVDVEDRVLGVICLLREVGLVYRRDEIINMAAISKEIGTYIQGNRQRQSVIALAERQRLVRDLHDSISQNLYGVVALTEAAKAGLEVKSLESQADFLSHIGETARLAVKEMRLFLHELQPVDLVHEGLVPALHQRLEAVEGRSDVKAVLITNYNGSLPLKTEVMLYYITQEALNNVLRHSHAKSVTVRLKQTTMNVTLEIEDFGCGFDITQVGNVGMGIRNMRERASLAGGTFMITSTPGKGTKITVTLQRDGR